MRTEQIAIIDDDERALMHKSAGLRDAGFINVETYRSPVKFVRRVAQQSPPDLIITDMQMDPITGLEMLDELSEIGVKSRHALLVSQADRPAGYSGDYLKKPALTEDYISHLVAAVQGLLGLQ